MALPWLAGAAVAATVGYLASSSSSSSSSSYDDDDDYYDRKKEAKKREKKQKKEIFKRAKNDFKIKWGVKYKEDFKTTEKYNEIQNKIIEIKQEMKVLESYSI